MFTKRLKLLCAALSAMLVKMLQSISKVTSRFIDDFAYDRETDSQCADPLIEEINDIAVETSGAHGQLLSDKYSSAALSTNSTK